MYRQSEKNWLNSNTSSTCRHNMADFGPLTAEIGSGVWGTPANSNGFRVLPSLLQRRRSAEANQTFTMFGRLLRWYTIYIFGGSCPLTEFAWCKIHFTSMSCVLLYWQRHCTALQQPASAKLCGVVQGIELRNFRRGRHLYSTGRPLGWASTHILVLIILTRSLRLVKEAFDKFYSSSR